MGRAPCCDKTKVKRGPWSPEEDALLKNFIQAQGACGNWIALPRKAGLNRCGKSCRLRWLNYLRPNIRHGGFTEEEDYIICTLFSAIGSRWSVIASKLPGRTDNDVKNYWNTKLKKKITAGKVPGFEPTSFCTTNAIDHPNCAQSVQPNPILFAQPKPEPEPEPIAYDHGYNAFAYCNIINNPYENSFPAQQIWDPLQEVSGHKWEVPMSSRCSSIGGGHGGEEGDIDDFWLGLLVDQSTFFGGSSQVVHHEKKMSGFDTVLGGSVFPSFC